MKAYGSPWRTGSKHNDVDEKERKMPPLLRLNSTGEVSGVETPRKVMSRHTRPRTVDRGSNSFLGKIASRLLPSPTGGQSAHDLVDIQTAVGGIVALEKQLMATKTVASYVANRDKPSLSHQTSKMPSPSFSPVRHGPSRYGRWAVDGLSPWMQPGVFPCHVFSAMQVGAPLSHLSGVMTSVSDSVLNCHVGQLPLAMPFSFLPGQGRSPSTCDKPSSSHTSRPSQSKSDMTLTESGHCVNTTGSLYQNNINSRCSCVAPETKMKDLHSSCQQGTHCTVSCQTDAESSVLSGESVEARAYGGKTVETAPSPVSPSLVIPSSCDTRSITPTTALCPCPLSFDQNQSDECEASMLISTDNSEVKAKEDGASNTSDCVQRSMVGSGAEPVAATLSDQNDGIKFQENASKTCSSLTASSAMSEAAVLGECTVSDPVPASGVEVNDADTIKGCVGTAAAKQNNQETSQSLRVRGPIIRSNSECSSLDGCDLLTDSADLDDASSTVDDNESEIDWETEGEEEESMTMDDDFLIEVSFLSNFLPGQPADAPKCAADCRGIEKVMDAFEVLFLDDKDDATLSRDDVDDPLVGHPRGITKRDVRQEGASIPCPAANARWNLHYPTTVPEKTNSKVTFQCGEGVDRYHEIEQVEVEANCSSEGGMTCMELQKLMDERKRQPHSARDMDSDEEDF